MFRRRNSSKLLLAALGLPVLGLLGCEGETGIDRTVIIGQLQIPPASADEGNDGQVAPNDEGVIEVPTLTYRYMTVTGSARVYASESGNGDIDTYVLRTDGDGAPALTFRYATGSELYWPSREELRNGELPRWRDTTVYKVEIIDPAWTDETTGDYKVLASFDDPDGYGGEISFDWSEVTVPSAGGGTYSPYEEGVPGGSQLGVRVTAVRGDSDGDTAYTMAFNGLDPNDGDILVGAYLTDDTSNRGSPVAGGSAFGFWWDEATLTWTGHYRMEGGVRRTVECEEGDQECLDSVSGEDASGGGGDDGGDGGDGGTTTKGRSAAPTDGGTSDGGTTDGGTTDGGTTDGGGTDGGTTDGGTDGGGTDGGTTDGGGTDTAEEPKYTGNVNEGLNDVYIMAGTFSSLSGSIPGGTLYSSAMIYVPLTGQYVVVDDLVTVDDLSPKVYGWEFIEETDGSLDAPVALPPPTGPGFVDVIQGTLLYEIDDPAYNNENDGFSITPTEELGALFTASWPDSGANMDLYVLDDQGNYLAAAYLLGDTNPEGFNAVTDFGFTFEPGKTYVINMEAWTGTAGEKAYTIEIEWTAP